MTLRRILSSMVVLLLGLIALGSPFGSVVDAQAAPTLTVSPTTASPGDTVTYTGAGWTGCGNLIINLLSPSGVGNVIAAFNSGTGSFSNAIPGGAPAELGTYTLTSTSTAGSGTCAASATFVVAAPTTTTTTTTTGATTTTAVSATSAAATAPTTSATHIPATGFDPMPLTVAGLALVAGVLLVVVARLRAT